MINHCEDRLRRGIKQVLLPNYYMKLQVHPLAHQKTVADFLLLTNYYNYAIECKQCSSNAFAFNRLSQEEKLIDFQSTLNRNKSYVCILFWKNRMDKSYMFLIPIRDYLKVKNNINKKSMNLKDCLDKHIEHMIDIQHSIPNIQNFLEKQQIKYHTQGIL